MPPTTVYFRGPVVTLCWLMSGCVALGLPFWLAQPWYRVALVLALWMSGVLFSFRLHCTPSGLTRRVGLWEIHLSWSQITRALITSALGWKQMRFVLTDRQGQQISFPLFLFDTASRQNLAQWLTLYLPPAIQTQWQADGADTLREIRQRK
jgi:hypothetical protein